MNFISNTVTGVEGWGGNAAGRYADTLSVAGAFASGLFEAQEESAATKSDDESIAKEIFVKEFLARDSNFIFQIYKICFSD